MTIRSMGRIDNERSGHETTRYFIRLGHQRIGCISGPAGAASSEERISGYGLALAETRTEFDRLVVKESDLTVELLIKTIKSKNHSHRRALVLNAEFIIRVSCGCVRNQECGSGLEAR